MSQATGQALEVLQPGLLTSVQDAVGRPGYAHLGVAHGGALDAYAAALAQALVGNPPSAGLLEVTAQGPTVRFRLQDATTIALCGADLGATLDGQPLQPGWSALARPGALLAFEQPRSRGARSYVAVAGGLDVPLVLGSRATDLQGGFGGWRGRALRAGDVVPLGRPGQAPPPPGRCAAEGAAPDGRALRVLPGPHPWRFAADALDTLCGAEWRVSRQADRMGYRLEGPPARHSRGADVASIGLPLGAIQVPGDGAPIVLLADHQPTGGYTVLAAVIRADLGRLAQRLPGDTVRFVRVSRAEAREALLAQRRAVAGLVRDGAEPDQDLLRWAGAGPAGRTG